MEGDGCCSMQEGGAAVRALSEWSNKGSPLLKDPDWLTTTEDMRDGPYIALATQSFNQLTLLFSPVVPGVQVGMFREGNQNQSPKSIGRDASLQPMHDLSVVAFYQGHGPF